jgi:hypothetical protein
MMQDDTTASTAAPAATAAPDRVIGIARNYSELLDALKRRTAELGVTMELVDEIAGLPARYVAKLFAPIPVKSVGKTSLGPLLGALGLKLIIAEDLEAFRRVKCRLVRSKHAGARVLARKKPRRYSIWHEKPALARLARKVQVLRQSRHKRRAIALQAARARWAKA